MRTMRTLVVALAAGCAGCSGAGQQTYKVASENPSSIRINFDPYQADVDKILGLARTHCAKYAKVAVPQPSTEAAFGLREVTFLCRMPGQ